MPDLTQTDWTIMKHTHRNQCTVRDLVNVLYNFFKFAGFGLLYYGKPRHTMTIAKSMNGTTELKTTSKVVTLTQETATADHS